MDLLERARAGCGGDPLAVGRILLKKESVVSQLGDPQGALKILEEAAPFVESSGEQRLRFAVRFKRANSLCHLERFDEAATLLPEVREMAVAQANELDLLRVMWLTAKADAGQGRTEEAVAGLEQVCRGFMAHELPYDAALASLDLAVLYLKESRTAEVRSLAVAMGRIFKMKGIDREALASFSLFCDAARQEIATVELARRIRTEMEEIRRSGEGSLRQAAQRPEEALELADLALSIAQRAPGEVSWRSRLLGFCWAHVANARRAAGNDAGAAEAFVRARELWRAGSDPRVSQAGKDAGAPSAKL